MPVSTAITTGTTTAPTATTNFAFFISGNLYVWAAEEVGEEDLLTTYVVDVYIPEDGVRE